MIPILIERINIGGAKEETVNQQGLLLFASDGQYVIARQDNGPGKDLLLETYDVGEVAIRVCLVLSRLMPPALGHRTGLE